MLNKDGEKYFFIYDDASRKALMGVFGSFAPAVLFLCHTKSAIHSCVISVRESRVLLRCMLYVAYRVPPEKQTAAAELFTRINYGLPLGTFEMDFSDGEICYRTGIDLRLLPARWRSTGRFTCSVSRYRKCGKRY